MERVTRRHDGAATRRPISAVLVTISLAAAGCGGDRPSIGTLVDGSRAQPRPSALKTLEGKVVVTKAHRRTAGELERDGRACVRSFAPGLGIPTAAVVVQRTGVRGVTLTFRDAHARFVLGCDRTLVPGENKATWCGHSAGEVFAGRLRDPRLNIGCRAPGNEPVGFLWIEPVAHARWLAIDEGSYTEVYEVVASLPVRVTTARVRTADSSAKVRLMQYDAGGSELTSFELSARVAG
jgi:hypothetical protein